LPNEIWRDTRGQVLSLLPLLILGRVALGLVGRLLELALPGGLPTPLRFIQQVLEPVVLKEIIALIRNQRSYQLF